MLLYIAVCLLSFVYVCVCVCNSDEATMGRGESFFFSPPGSWAQSIYHVTLSILLTLKVRVDDFSQYGIPKVERLAYQKGRTERMPCVGGLHS